MFEFDTNSTNFQHHLTELPTLSARVNVPGFLMLSTLKPVIGLFIGEDQISHLVGHEECRLFHRNM